MNRFQRFYARWYKVIGGAAITAGLILTCWTGSRMTGEASIQEGISEEIIRFHVIANSDTDQDQSLKMQVKNEVVSYMEGLLKDASSVDETRECINENLYLIEKKALEIVKEQGYDYPVTAALENCYFPMKTYGDMTFPAGDYEALRICIGNAEGKNWWCVLYPNLCFVDSIHAVVPEDEKKELQDVLTEEEYGSLIGGSEMRIRFGVLDWLG